MTQSQPGELIERMARAIADAREAARQENDARLAADGFWPDRHYQPDDRLLARAVLTAMREPTPGMVEAGLLGLSNAGVDDANEDDVRFVWAAVFDHILTEREG